MGQPCIIVVMLSLLVAAVAESITEEGNQLGKSDCTAREDAAELNLKLETQEKKLKEVQLFSQQMKIKKQLEEFNETKNWSALKRELEAIVNHESAAYKQLQYIGNDEKWPMWFIGINGYAELATVIVVGGQGVDVMDEGKGTILQGAAYSGRADMVESLLDHGSYMEFVTGIYCRTAILYATQEYRPEVVKLLARRGANLDQGNCDGDTSLHWAAWNGHLDLVKILVEAGANTAATNKRGVTALQDCERKGRTAVIEYLSQFPH